MRFHRSPVSVILVSPQQGVPENTWNPIECQIFVSYLTFESRPTRLPGVLSGRSTATFVVFARGKEGVSITYRRRPLYCAAFVLEISLLPRVLPEEWSINTLHKHRDKYLLHYTYKYVPWRACLDYFPVPFRVYLYIRLPALLRLRV